MKVAVYRERSARGIGMVLYKPNPDSACDVKDPWFVGYVDLNIETPKKTVVKDARPLTIYYGTELDRVDALIPKNAKNVKVTYETEE